MTRILPVLLVAGLALAAGTTGCAVLKGSITGRIMIEAGGSEYPASYYVVRLVDEGGTVLGTAQSDNSGYFRFRTTDPKTGGETQLKVPWGEYNLRIYKPSLGNSSEEDMIKEMKIILRKGVGKYDISIRASDAGLSL